MSVDSASRYVLYLALARLNKKNVFSARKKVRVFATVSVDPKTWFSCNRRDHPDAMQVLGDRNRPDRTSLRGRTLKGKGAVEFRYEET